MDLQKPGVCLEGVEHARLLLRRDDDRLHRKLRTAWHDRLQLLQHALGVGHVGDDEPRHALEHDGVIVV